MKVKPLSILLAALLLVTSFATGIFIHSAITTTLEAGSYDTTADIEPRRATGGRWTMLGSPIAGERVSTETEAAARLPYSLPRIHYMPDTDKISEIWVSTVGVPSNARSLAVVFDNGITLIVHQQFAGHGLGNIHSLARAPGLPFFELVQVNGIEGIGKDPGDQQLDDGSTWHYPGSVKWSKGDLVLALYGEYPLEELLKVAESIR